MSRCRFIALLLIAFHAPLQAQSGGSPAAGGMDPAQLEQLMEQARAGAAAGAPPAMNMDPAQMQQLMQQAAQIQACMAGVDMAALESMRQRSETVVKEIRAQCAAGARDDAGASAMALAKTLQSDPAIAQVKKCAAGAEGMLAALVASIDDAARFGDGSAGVHICDAPQMAPMPTSLAE